MGDYSVTAANVLASDNAVKETGVAGTTIAAGDVVYLDTNNSYQLADANAASPAYLVRGIALHASLANQPLTIVRSDPSFTPGYTIAANVIPILSANAGKTAALADLTTGWYFTALGVGIGSNKVKLNFLASGVAS